MSPVTAAVVLLKGTVLVLGGLVTYYSYGAYVRTGADALRALCLGFGVVTLGAALAGVVDIFVPVRPAFALLVESGFTTAGFGLLLYSLYVGGLDGTNSR